MMKAWGFCWFLCVCVFVCVCTLVKAKVVHIHVLVKIISVYADACKITHLNGVYVFPSLENDLWIEQSVKRQKYM